jgi:3-deoxy-D-manno-octulosonic-acid transferase
VKQSDLQRGHRSQLSLVQRVALGLYAGLMTLAQPWFKRKLHRRGVSEAGYVAHMDERFGHYTDVLAPVGRPLLWIHAVSLGETRAAAVLIAALRAQLPGMRLLLTSGTATGRAEALKLLQSGDVQCWQPWDTPAAVQRFLTHFKPDIGILMETEVWPHLVHGCQRHGVPLVLANARLSDKSLRQAQRLRWLANPAFAALAAVWAQTPDDAQRLQQLGAPVQGVFGNLKFDATPDVRQLEVGRAWRAQFGKLIVMLASAREGEELMLLQGLKDFRPVALMNNALPATDSIVSSVQWLIVPRHPQRFDAVAALIETEGFGVVRRSAWGAAGPVAGATGETGETGETGATGATGAEVALPPAARVAPVMLAGAAAGTSVLPVLGAAAEHPAASELPVIWLGDSLGEMALYYALADVALLGGSFAPLGGQNLIEAAACACPVVMGAHTFNFTQAAEQAELAGAAQRVADMRQGLATAAALALDVPRLQRQRLACQAFGQAHRGAAVRLAGAIAQVLDA